MAEHILRKKQDLEFEPAFDKAMAHRIEAAFTGQAEGITRRAALAVLTRSKMQLTDELDPKDAEALLAVAESLGPYIERLQGFVRCMQSAQARLLVVLSGYARKAA